LSRIYEALRAAAKGSANEPPDVMGESPTNGADRPICGIPAAFGAKVCVPGTPLPDSHIIADDNKGSIVREQCRYLEHELRRLRRSAPMQRILVTSNAPREGKTVVAGNLAATLASGSSRVLLIDGDMRGSGSGGLFGLDSGRGLAEVLEGAAQLSDVIVYLDALRMYYMRCGMASRSPADLIQNGGFRKALAKLEEFEWIVVDSAPIGAFVDALSMASESDGVVVVARGGVTKKAELERTMGLLSGYKVVGVVMNAVGRLKKRSYYSNYYQRPPKNHSSVTPSH
jgi:capsular exopolysaccharide synthesis family protein